MSKTSNSNDNGTNNGRKKMLFLDRDSTLSLSIVAMLIAASVWLTRSGAVMESDIASLKECHRSLTKKIEEENVDYEILRDRVKELENDLEVINREVKRIENSMWTKYDDFIFMQHFANKNSLQIIPHEYEKD